MRLLDLFSGAGGCAMGYHQAGFDDIVGVDIAPQPRYPFTFVRADALEYLAAHGHEFDAIHASPPCQFASEATPMEYRDRHHNYIPETRCLLRATGKPYVIENVEGARSHLRNTVMLCGTMLGLPIWRHRYFETWPMWLMSPATCAHVRRPITVHSGSHTRKTWNPARVTGGVRQGVRPRESVGVVRWAMGIDWMTMAELSQAIPPAYTRWIGEQLLKSILEAS
jgi:DNA (cytosine-5)-methyltransferase 1